jgi:hypothetical protein
MPTAAKLVSAIYFAVLAAVLCFWLMRIEPDAFDWSNLPWLAAVIGLVTGWRFVGRWAEEGWRTGLSVGLTGGVLMLFWALVISAGEIMVRRSIGLMYRGLMDGLEDMLSILADRALLAARTDVALIVAAGGLVGGALAAAVARVWR